MDDGHADQFAAGGDAFGLGQMAEGVERVERVGAGDADEGHVGGPAVLCVEEVVDEIVGGANGVAAVLVLLVCG